MSQRKSLVIWLLSTIILISCNRDNKEKIESINVKLDTSISPIKTTIEKLSKDFSSKDGKYIMVTGRFYYEFENVALWDYGIFPNSHTRFWLEFDREIDDSTLEKLSGKIVTIKGKIDSKDRGHLGWYLATINHIYFIKED